MVVFVVAVNFLIGLACLFIARKIWQVKRKIAAINERLIHIEIVIGRVLQPAPNAIMKAQRGTGRLRDRCEQLGIKYEQLQKIVSILSLGQAFWRYRRVMPFWRSGQNTSKKNRSIV